MSKDAVDLIPDLIIQGAQINAKDNEGNIPLLFIDNNPDMLKILLIHKADVFAANKNGMTLLHKIGRNKDLIPELLAKGFPGRYYN